MRTNHDYSHAFSRAWYRFNVFPSSSDWFIALFTSVVIGQIASSRRSVSWGAARKTAREKIKKKRARGSREEAIGQSNVLRHKIENRSLKKKNI